MLQDDIELSLINDISCLQPEEFGRTTFLLWMELFSLLMPTIETDLQRQSQNFTYVLHCHKIIPQISLHSVELEDRLSTQHCSCRYGYGLFCQIKRSSPLYIRKVFFFFFFIFVNHSGIVCGIRLFGFESSIWDPGNNQLQLIVRSH